MVEQEKNYFGQYVLIPGIKQLAVFPGGCWGLESELDRALMEGERPVWRLLL